MPLTSPAGWRRSCTTSARSRQPLAPGRSRVVFFTTRESTKAVTLATDRGNLHEPTVERRRAFDQERGLVVRVVGPGERHRALAGFRRQRGRCLRRLPAGRVADQRVAAGRREVRRDVLADRQTIVASQERPRLDAEQGGAGPDVVNARGRHRDPDRAGGRVVAPGGRAKPRWNVALIRRGARW